MRLPAPPLGHSVHAGRLGNRGLGVANALSLATLALFVSVAACHDGDRELSQTADGGSAGAGGAGAGGGDSGGEGGGEGGSAAIGGNDFVDGVAVRVHENVNTVLSVSWEQLHESDGTWLEFSFEDGEVMTSRAKPGKKGAHADVVLGAPEETEVSVRVVNERDGEELKTRVYRATTGSIPTSFPRPEVVVYEPDLASSDRWLFGSVEDSKGGAGGNQYYYRFTFWTYIMDRKGRIVWYYADPASNATSSFQRLARDGEYIWIEKRAYRGEGSAKSVLKMTLDWSYFEEIPIEISDAMDVTDDGGFLYDLEPELREYTKDGEIRTIWSCRDEFGAGFNCYSNTVNWNARDNTVFLSYPWERTVVEIDRESGDLVARYGAAEGSYAFSPDSWGFGFQHFPHITEDGTLLLSSHMPGFETTSQPAPGEHAFMEFTIDRENHTLIEKWVYHEGLEWPWYKGMAIRLANGNTLANYGSGGVIREITPDRETAFEVKFDVPDGDDIYNKMVGNNFYIDDLYSMNGGPE